MKLRLCHLLGDYKTEVMTLPPLHACNFFLPPLQAPGRLSSSDQNFAMGSALLSILRSKE